MIGCQKISSEKRKRSKNIELVFTQQFVVDDLP